MEERDPNVPPDEGQDDMSHASDADETLAPGSMPGGPEYPEEAAEPDR